ncbi:MAG TPA: hypothetical protein VMZ28_11935 [Kofleriaceae bacterium]|nr:hypothetical protein [Kofleriaceae bacterium]
MWRRTLDCLGVPVGILAGAALATRLDAVFRGYREMGAPPAVAYELVGGAAPVVLRDGAPARRLDVEEDLVPALELDLYREVVARAEGLVLHAGAVVGQGGVALVVAGRSGAGKSTLVRAMLAAGFGYISEECVALRGGRCVGLSRPLHVDDGAVAPPAGFTVDDYVVRQEGGDRRLRLFHPPEALMWRDDACAAAVVHIDHAPGSATALEPLAGGAALAELWPCAFRADQAALADAANALNEVNVYRLRSATPEAALARVRALAAELDVHPL